MAEAGDAGGKGAAHFRVDECHFGSLVEVFVVHVVDEVQRVDIYATQPVHHLVEAGHKFVVGDHVALNGRQGGTALLAGLGVDTARNGIGEALGEIGACAEELHLLAGLRGTHTAADAVVIAPHGTHHIVVLILYAAGCYADFCGIVLESHGQTAAVEHREVGLGAGPHVLERVEESEVVFRHHRASVLTHAAHLEGCPHGVAGEELVVGGYAGEFHHAELHHQVVDEFLCLAFGERAFLQVALDVDVEESAHASHAHGGAVLRLDGGEIAEVEPLHSLAGVLCGTADVEAVASAQLNHLAQALDLHRHFLAHADHLLGHGAVAQVLQILLLLVDEEVNAVERHAAIVAHDASAAVGVGQTSEDVVVAHQFHLLGVSVEHALVVRLMIFGEDFVEFGVGSIAISGAGLLCHLDAAVGHEGALQWLVGLQTHHLLQVLQFLLDISGTIGGDGAHDFRLHVQNAALGALFLLQLLQLAPQRVGGGGGTRKKLLIAIIGGVVFLDKVSHIHFFGPLGSLKASPFLLHLFLEILVG